ncbi:MAG TPA: hypothetical protein DCY07_02450 [Rhodospirillaceae bacterium]|nr:hypothetical protein [Rhodospirillaceae bacterium]
MNIDWSSCLEQIQKWQGVYEGKLVVVKFGGALAEDTEIVSNIAKQVDYLQKFVRVRSIVIHGGGKQIDQDLTTAGLEITRDKTTGLRVTDRRTLDVSDRSLRALNGKIVRSFHDTCREIVAVGSAGYDGKTLTAEPCSSELGGYTGHSPMVDSTYLHQLISCTQKPLVPVIYPICWNNAAQDGESRLNVNADDVACALATQMGAVRLIFCADVPGVLDKEGRLISELSPFDVDNLIEEGVVTGGMIAKLKSLGKAGEKMTTGGAVILDGRDPNAILAEILSDSGSGTLVRKDIARIKVVDAPKPK